MNELVINSEALYLGQNNSIGMEIVHPFAQSGIIRAGFAIPFEVPFCEWNERILKSASRIILRDRVIEFDAHVRRNGKVLHKGKLLIKEIEKANLSGRYTCDFITTEISADLFKKKLNEIPWPEDYNLGADSSAIVAEMKTIEQSGYPEYNFCFPILYWPGFYGSENQNFQQYINRYNLVTEAYYFNNISGGSAVNTDCIIPQLFIHFILKNIFAGFLLKGTFINDERTKALYQVNNGALDKLEKKYYVRAQKTITQIVSPSTPYPHVVVYDDETTVPNQDNYNIYNNSTGNYTIQTAGPHRVNFKISGYFTEVEQVMRVEVYVFGGATQMRHGFYDADPNGTITINDFGWADLPGSEIGNYIHVFAYFQIYDPNISSWVEVEGNITDGYIEVINITAEQLNRFDGTVKYANHVPGVTVGDYLAMLKETIGIGFFLDVLSMEIKIDWLGDVFKKLPKKWTDKRIDGHVLETEKKKGFTLIYNYADEDEKNVTDELPETYLTAPSYLFLPSLAGLSLNTFCLVLSENRFYKVGVDDSDNIAWLPSGWNYKPLEYGNAEDEIELKLVPALMERKEYTPAVYLIVPTIPGEGYSVAFNKNGTSPLRIGNHHGFQPSEGSNNYPMGSSTTLNVDGTQILAGYDLGLQNISYDLIYKNKMHQFRNMLATAETIRMLLQLNEADISELDFSRPVEIYFYWYVIKNISAQYSDRGISLCETELMKIA